MFSVVHQNIFKARESGVLTRLSPAIHKYVFSMLILVEIILSATENVRKALLTFLL